MGRRKKRRKAVPRVVRRLPKIFLCPNCSRQSLSISLTPISGTEYSEAVGRCGECGLCVKVVVPKIFQPVDAYGRIVDAFESFQGDIDELVSSGKCIEGGAGSG